MLYELIGIVRPGRLNEVKEIARTAGSIVLSRQGVVRGITNWGTFLLPKPLHKHQTVHHTGHYFVLRFDSSPKTQHIVKRTLSLDPRMIRYSMIKMGEKLEEIKNVGGDASWGTEDSQVNKLSYLQTKG